MFIREPWAVALPKADDVPASALCLHRVQLDQLLSFAFLKIKAALNVVRAWNADRQTDHSQGRVVGMQLPSKLQPVHAEGKGKAVRKICLLPC